MNKSIVEIAADIVQSQCSGQNMSTEEITAALQNTFNALQSMQTAETNSVNAGDVETGTGKKVDIDPRKSILKNKIICLECGQSFKILSSKHLSTHGLNGKSYRQKYGFSARQPLCSKALTEQRKKAGKERGIPENLKKSIIAKKKANTRKKNANAKKKSVKK